MMSGKKGLFANLFAGKASGGCCDLQVVEEEEAAVVDTSSCPVIVLGTGCANCKLLEANTKAAIEKLGVDVEVAHISDIQKIMEYNVMSVPALVLNQKVVSAGRVLKTEEIMGLLKKAL